MPSHKTLLRTESVPEKKKRRLVYRHVSQVKRPFIRNAGSSVMCDSKPDSEQAQRRCMRYKCALVLKEPSEPVPTETLAPYLKGLHRKSRFL